MVKICECCGHPLPDTSVLSDLTPLQRRLFTTVKASGTAGLALQDLIDALYGHLADGGPDYPRNVICVVRKNMQPRLAKHGLQIISTRGLGSRSYLKPLDAK